MHHHEVMRYIETSPSKSKPTRNMFPSCETSELPWIIVLDVPRFEDLLNGVLPFGHIDFLFESV